MSASNLWPNGNNKELIMCVANYLQSLLNESESKLDEASIDSLQVAIESLQIVISPDDEQMPPSPFSLTQLYEAYKSSVSQNNNDEQSASSKALPADIAQRRTKFLEFIEVLKKHKFFKDAKEGSSAYQARMEKARVQYNTRFPDKSIDSLNWIIESTDQQQHTPTDTDDVYDYNKTVTEEDQKEAEKLKNEGNQLLGKRQYQQAVDKYTAAISRNPRNAVYFCNRAAAYTYLKKYKQAVSDARTASEIDPNYVKAYVREGLAEYEMKNYEKALAAYQKARDKTPSSDKSWETYMEKVEDCKMKIEESKQASTTSNAAGNANNPFANLGNLAGNGGPGGGGMDFGNLAGLLQNPEIQKMAQQFMQDPNAMQQMTQMMGQMSGSGGGAGAGDNDMNVNNVIGDLLQNPEKAKSVFQQALNDPEAQQMIQQDPSVKPLIDKIVSGDYGAFLQLSQKPQAMQTVKSLIQKYYKP